MKQQPAFSTAAEIVLKKKKINNSHHLSRSFHHTKQNSQQDESGIEKQQFYKMVSREKVSIIKDPKPMLPCAGYYQPRFESIYPKCPAVIIHKKTIDKKRNNLSQKNEDISFSSSIKKQDKIKGYVDLEKQSYRKDLRTKYEGPHENRFIKVNEPEYWSNKKRVYSFFLDKQTTRKQQKNLLPDRSYDLQYQQVEKKISKSILPFDKYSSHQFKFQKSYTEHEPEVTEFKKINKLMNIKLDKQIPRFKKFDDRLPCYMNLHHSRLSLDTVNDKMLEQNCSLTIDRKNNIYDYKGSNQYI